MSVKAILVEQSGGVTNPETTDNKVTSLSPSSTDIQYPSAKVVYNELQRKSNPNLLDNWYFVGGGSQQGGGQFPINQRAAFAVSSGTVYYSDSALTTIAGAITEQIAAQFVNATYGTVEVGGTTYYVAYSDMIVGGSPYAGYAIDRWKLITGNSTLRLGDNGIVISSPAPANGVFDQIIENPSQYAGKTMTFSVLIDVRSGGFGIQGFKDIYSINYDNGLHTLCGTNLTNVGADVPSVRFFPSIANTEATIIAAKLELGDTQTLAHKDANGNWVLNEIPNYQEQLARCQTSKADSSDTYANMANTVGPKFVCNPNLLDNWYFVGGGSQQGGGQFPINQRGQTECTADGYFIDRFLVLAATEGSYCRLQSDGIEIAPNAGMVLDTYLEVSRLVSLTDVYTFSALIDDFLITASNTISDTIYVEYSKGSIGVHKPWTDRFAVRFNFNGLPLKIKAVKLELGDQQTLAHQDANGNWVLNEVPNYQEQLARCQRYYQIFPSISTIPGGVAPTSSAPIKKEAFRPVMAKDITASNYGTITIEGSTFYFADANL